MRSAVELSIVIPVFNGGGTIGPLVEELQTVFAGQNFEVVLVNDGSADNSEEVCLALATGGQGAVSLVQLNRNFGEHNAVLAGLERSRGRFVGILDDDGQNPPAELLRLFDHIRATGADVVYGRYVKKQHHWCRNLGSRFNDRIATWLVSKPRDLYLSSFKVMARVMVDEVLRYRGPFPYLDGLICRSTDRIAQLEVVHRPRSSGRSGYTFPRLVRLWLNMCLGFSLAPLHASMLIGGLAFCLGLLVLASVCWYAPRGAISAAWGSPGVIACILLSTGVQLIALGIVAEYVGRLFLHQSGMPQYVVRYVKDGACADE